MEKKIKVLVVCGIYPPAYSGSGLRAHRTYKRLISTYPIEFVVLTTTRGGFKPGLDEYDGVHIYRTNANKSFFSQISQVYRLFKKYKLFKFNLVHAFGDSFVVLAAAILAKYHSIKLIHEITILKSETEKQYGRLIKDAINYFRFGYARNLIYKKSDLVIALNEYIRQYYIRHHISEYKIWKRPNPVDTTKFKLPDNNEIIAIRRELCIPENKIVALVVGKFEPRKNQIFAHELIYKLPDNYYLLMVGPKDRAAGWYFDEIYQKVQANGINSKVKIFQGYHSDVEKYYKASDILWVPSKSEGTPNVMLEAMCCGIPVIVNRDLGLGEYLKNGENGLEEKLIIDKFRSATIKIERISNDKQIRYKIANSAQYELNALNIDKEFICKLEKLIKH
jgi:glycosyltransferase involved in cell wall biosynthesis